MNPQNAYSGFFNNANLPVGYTPDSLNSYFQGQLAPIDQQTAQNVGSAQTSAVARGLAGTPTETGAMGTAKYYGDLAKNQAAGSLAMNMAGLSNQDALIKGQQQWQSGENTLARQQQLQLANLGYGFQTGENRQQNIWGQQAGLAGLGSNMAGSAAGIGMLKYAGAFA